MNKPSMKYVRISTPTPLVLLLLIRSSPITYQIALLLTPILYTHKESSVSLISLMVVLGLMVFAWF